MATVFEDPECSSRRFFPWAACLVNFLSAGLWEPASVWQASKKSHPLPVTSRHRCHRLNNVTCSLFIISFTRMQTLWGQGPSTAPGRPGFSTCWAHEGPCVAGTPSRRRVHGLSLWPPHDAVVHVSLSVYFIGSSYSILGSSPPPTGPSLGLVHNVIKFGQIILWNGCAGFHCCQLPFPTFLPALDIFWPYHFFQSDATDGANWAQGDLLLFWFAVLWLLMQASILSYAY